MKIETISELRRNGSRIKNMGQVDATRRIRDVLANCHRIRGTKPKEDELNDMASEIYRTMMESYSTTTIEELENLTREAIYESTKPVIVSPVCIIQMVRDYYDSDNLKAACQRQEYIDSSRQISTSSVTAEEAAKRMLKSDYDWFFEHGTWVGKVRCSMPRGTFCYDYLVNTGRLAKDSWKQFKDRYRKEAPLVMILNGECTPEEASKAMAVTDYLENKVLDAKMKIVNMEDLPC